MRYEFELNRAASAAEIKKLEAALESVVASIDGESPSEYPVEWVGGIQVAQRRQGGGNIISAGGIQTNEGVGVTHE